MFKELNEAKLQDTAGGMPNPAATVGMTWEEVYAQPEVFQERWDAWRAENPRRPGVLGTSLVTGCVPARGATVVEEG